MPGKIRLLEIKQLIDILYEKSYIYSFRDSETAAWESLAAASPLFTPFL